MRRRLGAVVEPRVGEGDRAAEERRTECGGLVGVDEVAVDAVLLDVGEAGALDERRPGLPGTPRAKNIGHTSLSTRASTIGKIVGPSAVAPLAPHRRRPAARRDAGRAASRRRHGRGEARTSARASTTLTSNGARPSVELLGIAATAPRRVVSHAAAASPSRCRRPCVLRDVGRQTRPAGPTAAAAGSVTMPVPQATSITARRAGDRSERPARLVRRSQLLAPERLVVSSTARSHPCRCTQRWTLASTSGPAPGRRSTRCVPPVAGG